MIGPPGHPCEYLLGKMVIEEPRKRTLILHFFVTGLFLIVSIVLVTLAFTFNNKEANHGEKEAFKVNYDALSLVDIPVKGNDVRFVKLRRYYTAAAFDFVFVPFIHEPKGLITEEAAVGEQNNKEVVPFGLVNPGNYCFFNSLLQSFAAIHPYMLPYELKPTQLHYELAKDFVDFVINLRKGKQGLFIPSDPLFEKFRSSGIVLANYLFDYNQQDSSEVLNLLMRTVMEECKSFLSSFSFPTISVLSCDLAGHVTKKSELTQFVTLPIIRPDEADLEAAANSHDVVKIESLLEMYSSSEKIEHRCDLCDAGTSNTSTKRLILASPPPHIFIIALNRFDFNKTTKNSTKVNVPVKIPEILEQVFENEDGTNTKARYKLIAMNLHSGCVSGGHYTALVRYPSRKTDEDVWFYCNDSTVTKSSLDTITDGNYGGFTPYILFYVSC